MITVISKHLHLIQNGLVPRELVLRNIHYIELIRYKKDRIGHLSANQIDMPADFNPGIEIGRVEAVHYYRFMAIWFEIETLVKSGRSFLDHFWRTVACTSPDIQEIKEVCNQKYLSQALNVLRQTNHPIKQTVLYQLIDNIWQAWARYLINFRNYLEYTEPLGGMLSQTIGRLVQSGSHIEIELPDQFPGHKDDPQTFNFTFNNRTTINNLATRMCIDIDEMFPAIITEIHNMLVKRTR